ncbi:MAG: PQQ-binding-like beta-propeller repeat protein [Phycisphaerae bacterium]|nr:PQQ-binding-like beta-propeller repeat protein [Phycisphaerae bacterium]
MISFAVVPIFVNTGAALLPTLAAGIASALALLFKPRELVRACRRRPFVAALVPLGIVALAAALWYWAHRPTPPPPRRIDWAQVAVDLLRRDRAAALPLPAATQPADAPVGLGRDFTRRGWDGTPSPDKLSLLWEHRVEDACFLSSPAVVAGRVYAATYVPDITGKFGTGSVVCLDARTHRKIWETSKAGGEDFKPFFSSPAVSADGRRVIIGQGLHEDANCSLICLDAADGKVLWQAATPLHIEGSPAIRGDMVVVGAGAIEDASHKPTGHAGMVLAVRISDGKELWRCDVADPESSPAIDANGVVYIGSGFNGNAVVALRGDTDAQLATDKKPRILWRRESPYPVTGAVSLVADLVIVGAGNGDYVYANPSPAGVVLALDRATGEIRWQRAFPDAVLGAIAAGADRVICPVRNGEVVALSIRDGSVLWRQRVSERSPVLAGVVLTDRHVFAVSKDGYLGVLAAADGRVLDKQLLNDPKNPGKMGLCFSTPTVVGGCLFVGTESGGLRCYGPATKDDGASGRVGEGVTK